MRSARGLRHPRGADEDGPPDPSPGRRAPSQDDGPSEVVRGRRVADQDHGEDGHRREAASAGRPDRRPRGGRNLDLRVSTVPANYGEKVVIRILDSANANIPLELIGFSAAEMAKMLDIISRPQGIVLITGPTGSGKTTTSTGSSPIKSVEDNITTIEDPIEYELRGSTRWRAGEDRPQLRRHAPLDAAAGPGHHHGGGDARPGYDHDRRPGGPDGAPGALHDPHNSSVATITRLRDLGVPSYLIASTIVGSWRSAWSARSA